LHARASMKLVDTASRFQANVTVISDGKSCDAKDILQAMSLGAPMGTQVEVIVEGTDEEQSMQAIIKLIEDKFGEE
jgi:phosphocarrier protein HPr